MIRHSAKRASLLFESPWLCRVGGDGGDGAAPAGVQLTARGRCSPLGLARARWAHLRVENRARLREPDRAVYGMELMVTLTVRRACELLCWRSLFRESFPPRCGGDLILTESVSTPLEYNVGRTTGRREEEPRTQDAVP